MNTRKVGEHAATAAAGPAKTDWITFASVMSCIAVVILHTNGCFWEFSATESWWRSANVIECVFYFAVPVFFMITGATLLDFYKRYGLREYFGKRAAKTVVPYVFWSFAYLVLHVAMGKLSLGEVTIDMVLTGLGGGRSPASTGSSSRSSASTSPSRCSPPSGTRSRRVSTPTSPLPGFSCAVRCRL